MFRTATNETQCLYYWPVVMRCVQEMCGGGRILLRLVTMLHRYTDFRNWMVRSILTLLGSGHQTCTKLTSAECTVENS